MVRAGATDYPRHGSLRIQSGYRRWRLRVLLAGIIGYAAFYFVRKNLSVAMPLMEKELGFSKVDLGLVPDLARSAV